MDINNLSTWLEASMQAFYDFAAQNFSIEELPEFNKSQINYLNQLEEIRSLKGSFIELSLESKKINVFFLAQQETLNYIANRILSTNEDEKLDDMDVVDAIKELTNIIAGGVKNRLSAEVEGEIVLGLPAYIDKYLINQDKSFYVLGCFNFDNKTVYILIEKNTHADVNTSIIQKNEDEIDDEFQYLALIEQLKIEKQEYANKSKQYLEFLNEVYDSYKEKLKLTSEKPFEKMNFVELREVFKLDK